MSHSRSGLTAKTLLLFIALLCKSVFSFAHRVQVFNTTGCTAGSTVTITAVVTSAPSNTYYDWQYKDNTGTWKFFTASSTINGTVFTVTGYQYGPASNNAGTLTIANATSALENVQIRVLMSEDVRPRNAGSGTYIWGGDDQEKGYAKMLRLHIYSNPADCGGTTPGCIGNLLMSGSAYYGGFEAKTYSTSNGYFTDNNFASGNASTDFSNGSGTSETPSTSGTGTYFIWSNPYGANHNNAVFAPHSGNFQMIIQSASNTQKRAWYKTVTVTPGAVYNFSAWVARTQGSNAFNLKLTVNGVDIITSAVSTNLGEWAQVAGSYTIPANVTSVVISVSDVSTSSARYYSLDDICFAKVLNNASLGDRVWSDINANGIQDAGEPGISGVSVQLRNSSNAVIATTATDASGLYSFTGLYAGTYTVVFPTTVNGAVLTGKDAGANDAADSDPATATGITGSYTLAAGDVNTTVDAGYYVPMNIGNKVWYDVNNNGTFDANEPGISGVTVKLYAVNNNGPSGSVCGTAPENSNLTLSAPAGAVFTSVKFASYGTPAGSCGSYAVSGCNASNSVTVVGSAFLGQNSATIGANNTVFGDPCGGTVKSLAVELNYTYSTQLIATTTTNSTGDYLFSNLVPGTPYVIAITAPAGYAKSDVGTTDVRLDNQNDGVNVSGSDIQTNSFIAYVSNNNIDFGLKGTGSLGDFVWNDVNANGIQDAGEAGIANAAVQLTYPGGATASATTNASGNYSFTNLAPGNYTVTFTTPSGYAPAVSNAGSDDTKDSDPVSGVVNNAVVTAGAANTTVDAGFYAPISIGNKVWIDMNNNGILDANEQGMPGVTVKLYNAAGTYLNISTVTDPNGIYSFTNLAPGSYIIGITAPTGYAKSDVGSTDVNTDNQNDGVNVSGTDIRTNAFTTNVSTNNIDFGLKGTGSVGDFVWFDKNANGLQDAGETGIANDLVILTYPDNVTTASTYTNASGNYLFSNLAPGTYKVQFTTLDGYVATKSNIGSDDTNDSDPVAGIVNNIVVTAGAGNLTVDAGFYIPVKAGNFVWYDKNNNGIQDAGEPGIPGVTVKLYADDNSSVCGTAVENSTLTLSAPAGIVFNAVKFASYGTPAGSCGNFAAGSCNAANSTAIVGAAFLGQNSATIGANNSVFGDPCGGIVKSLAVELTYNQGDNIPDGAAIATATTNAAGNYTFSNLAPGRYIVGITVPNGYLPGFTTASSPNPDNDNNTDNNGITLIGSELRSNAVTLVSGDEPLAAVDGDNNYGNLTLDFALKGNAAIGDFVWNDLNRNGLQDAGEPGIAGATVTLTYPDATTKSVQTDQNGAYNFTGLVPGTYSVSFATPAGGFNPAAANVNANGSDLIDSDPVGGTVSNITLASGETNNSIDAGFFKPINIYGNVWHDANAMDDGQVNKTSNTPIPNTLVVYLVDDATGLVVDGYSIGQDGVYEFDNVQINHVYRLVLSTALVDPGQPSPPPSLPTGWFNTGENLGAGPFSGNDGQTDGRLFIETETSDVHDANFGIRLGNGEIIIG